MTLLDERSFSVLCWWHDIFGSSEGHSANPMSDRNGLQWSALIAHVGEVYLCRPTPKEPYSDNVHNSRPSLDKHKLVGFWQMPLPKSPGELGFDVCVGDETVWTNEYPVNSCCCCALRRRWLCARVCRSRVGGGGGWHLRWPHVATQGYHPCWLSSAI